MLSFAEVALRMRPGLDEVCDDVVVARLARALVRCVVVVACLDDRGRGACAVQGEYVVDQLSR